MHHTLDATFVLLLWSNLANHQISASVSTLSTTEHESQNTTNHQNQASVLFVGGDTFEGENSLELLNDSYSSGELVTSSSEFSDNLKDIFKVDKEEEEEGSTISSEDNFYNSEEEEEYNDGEGEQESDLKDEGDLKSDFDLTSRRSPALESGKTVAMSEVDLLTKEGKLSETTTNGSLSIKKEESSSVFESLEKESFVKCFYVAPSSTFANLPDSISCSCAGSAGTFKVLHLPKSSCSEINFSVTIISY